jgi:hypothetical protein
MAILSIHLNSMHLVPFPNALPHCQRDIVLGVGPVQADAVTRQSLPIPNQLHLLRTKTKEINRPH